MTITFSLSIYITRLNQRMELIMILYFISKWMAYGSMLGLARNDIRYIMILNSKS